MEELYRQLRIRPVSEEECLAAFEDWERRTGKKREHDKVFMPGIPLEEAAAVCDGYCWPITEKLAPMIAAELEGADTVLEVGFGTALRLTYYAKKVPDLNYRGVESDALAVRFARQRLNGLGLTEVVLEEKSLQDLNPSERRFSRVILAEVSTLYEEEGFKTRAHALKLVDDKPGSKFIVTNYATWSERELVLNVQFASLAQKEGLQFVKSECFDEDMMGHLVVYERRR